MGFNLDRFSPQAMGVGLNDIVSNRPFFLTRTISLSKGEQAVLFIEAATACYDVKFDLAVSYAIGTSNYTEIVTNHGQPFQVTALRKDVLSYRQVLPFRITIPPSR
jgi:hypothetical protein